MPKKAKLVELALERLDPLLDRPIIDWATTAVLVTAAWKPLGLLDRLTQVRAPTVRSVYTGSAVVAAILAGFTVSAIFYFATSDTPTLEAFRKNHGPRINRTLVGTLITLVLCAAGVLAATLAAPTSVAAWLFASSMLLAGLKMLRVSALSWMMLTARYRDNRQRPVVVEDDWAEAG